MVHTIASRPGFYSSVAPFVEWPICAAAMVCAMVLEGPEQFGSYITALLVSISIGGTALVTRLGPAIIKYRKDRDDAYAASLGYRLDLATKERAEARETAKQERADAAIQIEGLRKQISVLTAALAEAAEVNKKERAFFETIAVSAMQNHGWLLKESSPDNAKEKP